MDTSRMKVLIEQREEKVAELAKIDTELRSIIDGQPRQKRTWTRRTNGETPQETQSH